MRIIIEIDENAGPENLMKCIRELVTSVERIGVINANVEKNETSFIRGKESGSFFYQDCHDIWEELGAGDYPNLKKSAMPPQKDAASFVQLKSKYLKTSESWREYFIGLDSTEYADKNGFPFYLAMRIDTYEKFKNGGYGVAKTPDPMEMFHG